VQIAKHRVVTIHYTLKNKDGEILDSSAGQDPLAFIHGAGQLIAGLEDALIGKKAGEKLKVAIPAEKAYGERSEDLLHVVDKKQLPQDSALTVGMQFEVDTDHGSMLLTVTEIREEDVVLDANHPLAGEELHFEVDIIGVRDATKEEMSHGHVHGPGGHHH
jgi:FKBP-type peptidyl-prolyl cis-trans isomerase SlyD